MNLLQTSRSESLDMAAYQDFAWSGHDKGIGWKLMFGSWVRVDIFDFHRAKKNLKTLVCHRELASG
jgi:hypothetical protein